MIDRARKDEQIGGSIRPQELACLLLDTAHGSMLRAADAPPGSADPAQTTRNLLEVLT